MKVVITTDCFLPRWDGVARFLNELLPFLDCEVVVFAPDFGSLPALPPNVSVHRFSKVQWRFGDIYFALPDRSLMKKHISDADVVFNQTIGPIGKAGIRLARKLKKPVVSFVHSIEWRLVALSIRRFRRLAGWIVRRRARKLYNKCSLLLVPSHEVEDLLTGNRIRTRKEVVHLGVDVQRFRPPHSKAVAKRRIGLSPSSMVVGFCGRIGREKSLPTLVDAFHRLRRKLKDSLLLVVGEGLEDEIRPSDTIVRAGRQDDVVPFLQAMDVFVLPSLTETTSLATLEAMSCAVPVVVTPVGNLREYILDGQNGLFFSREDPAALAERLVAVLSNDQLRSKLGSEARKTIVEKFSWKVSADMIVSWLKEAAR